MIETSHKSVKIDPEDAVVARRKLFVVEGLLQLGCPRGMIFNAELSFVAEMTPGVSHKKHPVPICLNNFQDGISMATC